MPANNEMVPPLKKMRFNESNGFSRTYTNKNKVKMSLQEQRSKLPIYKRRKDLVKLIEEHDTLIILGETGSGKTTQIPQIIVEAGLHEGGLVAVTQPRRVAAISVAMRVAQEYGHGMEIGDFVGYCVRFEDLTSAKTELKYMTDGMLLREALGDSLLLDYSFIILDEAHERTIHTDVLFGIVKSAQQTRRSQNLIPLKILIMSATMNVDHFAQYFGNCEAVYVEGRTYAVEIFHSVKPHEDYVSASVATFFKIHRTAPADHAVLIFLTGQEEIEAAAHQIRILTKEMSQNNNQDGGARVFPLYAAQSSSQQMLVFQTVPPNVRKVVVSTNVAETSVTIPGIRYVIDCGMVKNRSFAPETGLEMLRVERVSHEQAWQRAGRAGRQAEGVCFRLYTRQQFDKQMLRTTVPEIQRANVESTVLNLLAMGIQPIRFDFMDKPNKQALDAAFEHLIWLGALSRHDDTRLGELGKNMSKLPLAPRYAKILLSAPSFGCLEEALTVVSILSSESILLNPQASRQAAFEARRKFYSGYGDHVTLLNIYKAFSRIGQTNIRAWCHEHFINMRNILMAREVRQQLLQICTEQCRLEVGSCGSNMVQLRKCLLTGLFTNVAELQPEKHYLTLDKKQVVHIHPSSVIHGQKPGVVLFSEVVKTSKCYLRTITSIEADWLAEVVPQYAKRHRLANCNGV